jgi:hypothetical protein
MTTPLVTVPSSVHNAAETQYMHHFIEELSGITMTPMEVRSAVASPATARPRAVLGLPAR